MGGGSIPNMPPDSGTDSAAPVLVNVTANQVNISLDKIFINNTNFS